MSDVTEVEDYIIQRRWADESAGEPKECSYHNGKTYVCNPLKALGYILDDAIKEMYKLKSLTTPGFYNFVIKKRYTKLTQINIKVEETDE